MVTDMFNHPRVCKLSTLQLNIVPAEAAKGLYVELQAIILVCWTVQGIQLVLGR